MIAGGEGYGGIFIVSATPSRLALNSDASEGGWRRRVGFEPTSQPDSCDEVYDTSLKTGMAGAAAPAAAGPVVCEFVRIKSSLACASAHSCSRSVCRMRVSSRQSRFSTSLRGWRSQERESSNLSFRTTPKLLNRRRTCWRAAPLDGGTSAGGFFSSMCNGCQRRGGAAPAFPSLRDDHFSLRHISDVVAFPRLAQVVESGEVDDEILKG